MVSQPIMLLRAPQNFNIIYNLLCVLSWQKRRFCLQQASDLPETVVQASKSFVMGVALGLSGVIMKPIIGKLVMCFECVGTPAYICRDKHLYSRCSKLC
jgi:hypothetical protein